MLQIKKSANNSKLISSTPVVLKQWVIIFFPLIPSRGRIPYWFRTSALYANFNSHFFSLLIFIDNPWRRTYKNKDDIALYAKYWITAKKKKAVKTKVVNHGGNQPAADKKSWLTYVELMCEWILSNKQLTKLAWINHN